MEGEQGAAAGRGDIYISMYTDIRYITASARLIRFCQLGQERCQRFFSKFVCRELYHGVIKPVFRICDGNPVHFQEDQRRGQGRAFVAVNKGLILRDMERIGGCHLKKRSVQELPAKTGLRN